MSRITFSNYNFTTTASLSASSFPSKCNLSNLNQYSPTVSLQQRYYTDVRWRVLLNCAPTSTQFHPFPPSTFHPPPSSLQHPQCYKNQIIARNLAISRNLGRKIQSWTFCLKISAHGILEEMIPNPNLDFRNSDHKIHFWANLSQKS